jgi:hypothetical protein
MRSVGLSERVRLYLEKLQFRVTEPNPAVALTDG